MKPCKLVTVLPVLVALLSGCSQKAQTAVPQDAAGTALARLELLMRNAGIEEELVKKTLKGTGELFKSGIEPEIKAFGACLERVADFKDIKVECREEFMFLSLSGVKKILEDEGLHPTVRSELGAVNKGL